MVKGEGWICAIKLLLLIVSGTGPSTCSPLPRDGGGMPTHPTFLLLINTANIFSGDDYNNSPPLSSPCLHLSTFWKKKESWCFYIFSKSLVHPSFAFSPDFQSLLQVCSFFPYTCKNWKYILEKCLKNFRTLRWPISYLYIGIHIHACSFTARSTMNAEFALILRNSLLHTHTYSNALLLVPIHPLPRWHIYSLSPSPLSLPLS